MVTEYNLTVKKRQDDDARERIQGYLDRSGLSGSGPRVVPLTPDASDRRYFRILLPGQASIVLSLYSGAFDVTTLPFVNVATLMAKMPVPIPEVLGHADIGTTLNLYAHILPTAKRAAADAMDAYLRPSEEAG